MSFELLLNLHSSFKTINAHFARFSRPSLRLLPRLAMLASASAAMPVAAQESGIYQEQERLIKAPNAILKADSKLFGDAINLYTGSLEFVHTDADLPGNNKLRVEVL